MSNLASNFEYESPYHLAVIASDEAREAYWKARNRLAPEIEEALQEDLDRIHDDYRVKREERMAKFHADHGLTDLDAAVQKANAVCAEYEEQNDDEDDV